jgi:hypothetical protein
MDYSIANTLQALLFEPKQGRQPSERDVIIGELFKGVDEEDRKHQFYTVDGKTKKRRLYTIKSFAVVMAPHSLEKLYYFKSICNDCKKRGGNYSKCLFGAIKVCGQSK